MHTHPGVCVSFFTPAPAMEPARPTDDVRPIFGLVCGNSRRRLAISAATSRFIPCLRWAAHALLRILRPHASLFIIHHRGPQCNEKAASGVIFLLKLVFCAAKAQRERAKAFARRRARAGRKCPRPWRGLLRGGRQKALIQRKAQSVERPLSMGDALEPRVRNAKIPPWQKDAKSASTVEGARRSSSHSPIAHIHLRRILIIHHHFMFCNLFLPYDT